MASWLEIHLKSIGNASSKNWCDFSQPATWMSLWTQVIGSTVIGSVCENSPPYFLHLQVGEIAHWSDHHWSIHFHPKGHPSNVSFIHPQGSFHPGSDFTGGTSTTSALRNAAGVLTELRQRLASSKAQQQQLVEKWPDSAQLRLLFFLVEKQTKHTERSFGWRD